MSGFVYFIVRPSTDSLKIGFSADPERRLRQLQTGSDEPLQLLAFFEATFAVEKEIHRRLSGSRMSGEWFQRSREVEELILYISGVLRAQANEGLALADKMEAEICDGGPRSQARAQLRMWAGVACKYYRIGIHE
jgi:hypothetical protein